MPTPANAVLDTQVVLDWLVFRDPGVAAVAQALERGELRWLASPAMLGEIEHVLGRGVGAAWKPDRQTISDRCARLACLAEPAAVATAPLRCADPDDQMFIDLALAAGAQWLFTRDRALLRLARRAQERGVVVLRPADWRPRTVASP